MSQGVRRPEPADVAFVFQGRVGPDEKATLTRLIGSLRELAPGCLIVVSTWADCAELVGTLGADTVVLSQDPGALHSIRADGKLDNNINRQIVSTRAGLMRCDRPFSVKMRTDALLTSMGFLDLYAKYGELGGTSRLLVPRLFTVDPELFERMPMHVSDWFQFGRTEALRRYWDCPLMTAEEASWYGSRPYARRSTHFDRRIYCRFAVEQHIARSYAAELGLPVPDFHNDTRPEVMAAHRELLGRHLVVADLDQLGLVLPKYDWAEQSEFQNLNCVDFIDWLGTALDVMQVPPTADQRALIRARKKRKTSMRLLYSLTRPFWRLLSRRSLKPVINFLLGQLSTRRAERG